MNHLYLVAAIYLLVGLYFTSLCKFDDELDKAVIFVTWPLIAAMFIMCIVIFIIIALVYTIMALIQWFIQTITRGGFNGVV